MHTQLMGSGKQLLTVRKKRVLWYLIKFQAHTALGSSSPHWDIGEQVFAILFDVLLQPESCNGISFEAQLNAQLNNFTFRHRKF